jgi:prolyl-tRNA synthetase
MMQDGRALQAGTSHYLGHSFAKSCNIQFQSREGNLEYVHTTSWGMSTRMLGALVMTHGDDNGMKIPPRIAPYQIVIIPILRDDSPKNEIMSYCDQLKSDLLCETLDGNQLRIKVDARDIPGSEKRWDWIKKGAPLIVEIGPKDIAGNKVCLTRRDKLEDGKSFEDRASFIGTAGSILADIQQSLFRAALDFRASRTVTDIKDWASFEAYFKKDADSSFTGGQGFIRAKWCGDETSLAKLDPLGVTVRCIPFDQDGKEGVCVLTGKPATQEVIFARAY